MSRIYKVEDMINGNFATDKNHSNYSNHSMMKRFLISLFLLISVGAQAQQQYTPTAENLKSRKDFSDRRFGIFIHWGLYSMFAQGEWYMQDAGITREEYGKSARGFYPAYFNAHDWVKAAKDAGAGYICLTSRHHDGFSLWHTSLSDYNIVDGTPFGRDIIKELADECHKQGIRLHFYYSHIDWGRDDYPLGMSGRNCGKDTSKADWPHYYQFMNGQLTELLTRYGDIGAIWFDGWWDLETKDDKVDGLIRQYEMIHRLQPSCLIGNNHHLDPYPGEDIQIFERDLPGNNSAGWNSQGISRLPLETCETMNGMWGYKVTDQNYKSVDEIVHYLVNAAGKGANLLLNVGPQPSGEIPATALERLKGVGEWMRQYGETIRGTEAGPVAVQDWGATTRKGNRLFVHILKLDAQELLLPADVKVKKATVYGSNQSVKFSKNADGTRLQLPEKPHGTDYIIELQTK